MQAVSCPTAEKGFCMQRERERVECEVNWSGYRWFICLVGRLFICSVVWLFGCLVVWFVVWLVS
jgi:hypothetical protein